MAARRDGGEILVGLDIGTTKVAAVVGEVTERGIDVIGVGQQMCKGFRRGTVINIDQTAASIRAAVAEAAQMSGCEIGVVHVGISGQHVQALDSTGLVAVKGGEVTPDDVARVLENARAQNLPRDREILHAVPQEYVIDDEPGIHEPVGMSGVRLEAKVHIVTGGASQIHNMLKCCALCDIEVAGVTLEHIAAAEATLQDDEKKLGVALVDIGGSLTNVAVYADGTLRHTAVVAMGGSHISNDIRIGLRTVEEEAERIKRRYACALASMVDPEESINVPRVGHRPPDTVPRSALCSIVGPRVEEILTDVRRAIDASGFADVLNGGVVLTGGGACIAGLEELAEQVMQMHGQVRVGKPVGFGGMTGMVDSPMFATAVGLLLRAARRENGHDAAWTAKTREREGNRGKRILEVLRQWF
ncbi:MAG: cell division protein FtsA [Myxococcota bacterium]|nr:cell division protein FtsA [Myxococcota bacterium]